MSEIKNCPRDTFFSKFELFAITNSDELSFSNTLTNTDTKLHKSSKKIFIVSKTKSVIFSYVHPTHFIGDRNKLLKSQNVGFSK